MDQSDHTKSDGARHGRRARCLLQRYLVVFGPIHGLEESAPKDPPVAQLALAFFAGQIPGPESMASVERLTALLAADEHVDAPRAQVGVWARFDQVCARLALDRVAADALLLLVAPVIDAGTRWLVHAVFGEEPWSADRLRCVLAPLASVSEPVWAATSPGSSLVRDGLVIADGQTRRPSPALLDHLCGHTETPVAALARPAHEVATLAARAPLMPESLDRMATALEHAHALVLRAHAGDGVTCLAAWACHDRGVGMLELTADELAALPTGALVLAVMNERGLLLHGVPTLEERRVLERLCARGALVLIHVSRDTPRSTLAGLCRSLAPTSSERVALERSVLELPSPTVQDRRRWWRDALAATNIERDDTLIADLAVEPLAPDHIGQALAFASLDHQVLRRACRELAPTPLDHLLDRVVGGISIESEELTASVTAVCRDIAARQRPGVVFVEHGSLPLSPVAYLLARELGVRAFDITISRALRQGRELVSWLADVLSIAVTFQSALVFSDLSALIAANQHDAGVFVALLHEHRGLVFVSASERAFFTGDAGDTTDERAVYGPFS